MSSGLHGHTRYACPILIYFNFLVIFSKNIKFHENPSSGSRVVPCGRTDRHDDANSRLHLIKTCTGDTQDKVHQGVTRHHSSRWQHQRLTPRLHYIAYTRVINLSRRSCRKNVLCMQFLYSLLFESKAVLPQPWPE